MEEGTQEFGVSQPVGRREGLRTEVPVAEEALVTLNPERSMGTMVEALLLEPPRR
jgi:septum formation inhibitor-activating ATPase MinD